MADSIVIELQREAYNSKTSVSDLLRKAYIIAKKLKVSEFETWIDQELKGYKAGASVPDYRKISGEVKAWNPYNGWIPLISDDVEMMNIMSKNRVIQSIPELESLLTASDSNILMMQLPNKFQRKLSQMAEFDTNYNFHFGKSQIDQIINYVRSTILEWSLKLEADGILGEDMSFSSDERRAAKASRYTVNNYHGNISNSQFQQDTVGSSQTMNIQTLNLDEVKSIITMLKSHLEELNLNPELNAEIVSEIRTIEAQMNSPKPKRPIVVESLSSIRSVLEGITGSLIASGILYEIAKLNLF